jgi:flagellar biogenesis protein FliO
MSDLTLSFIRAIVSLSVTLGLIVLVGWVWKNYGQTFIAFTPKAKTTPRLNVLESRKLNPTTTLHLVRHDDTEHLIATTSAQTTLISTRSLAKSSKVKS